MNSLQERQPHLREDAIIETARELHIQKGYAQTGMDDIAAHLWIGKATLYLDFKSKKELALSIIIHDIKSTEAVLHSFELTLPGVQLLELLLCNGIQRRAHV